MEIGTGIRMGIEIRIGIRIRTRIRIGIGIRMRIGIRIWIGIRMGMGIGMRMGMGIRIRMGKEQHNFHTSSLRWKTRDGGKWEKGGTGLSQAQRDRTGVATGSEPSPGSLAWLSHSPVPRIKWRKLDGPQSSKWMGSEPLLQIQQAGFEDEGTYECEAENAKGRDTHQGRIIIHGNAPKHVPWPKGHILTRLLSNGTHPNMSLIQGDTSHI